MSAENIPSTTDGCRERVTEQRWGFHTWRCGRPVKAIVSPPSHAAGKSDLAVCGIHARYYEIRGWGRANV